MNSFEKRVIGLQVICLCFIVLLIYFLYVDLPARQAKEINEAAVITSYQEVEPMKVTGQYTMFTGYTKPIYIEAYYLVDNEILYYKEKGIVEFIPINFDDIILAPRWLEGKELIGYGFYDI